MTNPILKVYRLSCFLSLARYLLLGLLALKIAAPLLNVRAESLYDGWSVSSILFQRQEGWLDQGPSLVADSYGNVHLAWAHVKQEGEDSSLVFYSRWNGSTWTTPVDVFVVSSGWPVLVPTISGKLHVFWNTGSYLYHSWAPVLAADTTQSWSAAEVVVYCDEGCSVPIDALEDKNGVLHVVFSYREGSAYYTYSEDEGTNWSPPSPVSVLPPGTTTFAPKIAVADDGRIHAVWPEVELPEGEYLRLNYAQSTDHGQTWTLPMELGAGNHADGNLLTVGDDEVHLAWNGGVGVVGRFYMRSDDGGVTWSEPVQISSGAGRAGYPSIVRDTVGQLHILTGQGEYVSRDRTANWSMAQPLPFFNRSNEQSRLAVVNGNQLIAITPRSFSGIHYSIKALDISALPAQSFPQIASTQTPPSPTVTSNNEVSTPVPTLVPFEAIAPPVNNNQAFALVVPTVTGLLIVVLGIVLRRQRS